MADEPILPQPDAAPEPEPVDPFAWSKERKDYWDTAIKKAQDVQDQYHPWWNAALKNYAPSVKENPNDYELRVRTNRAFALVERKKASQFYKRPDVTVSSSPLLEQVPNNAAMSAAHATIINHKLGRRGINATALARDVIFAQELFGAGWCKVFYRAYTRDVTRPIPGALPDQITGQVPTETIPVPMKTECGCEAFSNKQALIPYDFRGIDFDKAAPWLGMRFTLSLRIARRTWGAKIPADFKGSTTPSGKQQFFDSGAQQEQPGDQDVVTGVEIYYRSMMFRDDIAHPDHLTKLVFLDGIDAPVEERDDPDQTLDAQGRMTPDSRIGFPYHPLIVRSLTDSAYVMSDVAVALPLTRELDRYREQGQIQRGINATKFVYDTAKLPPDEVAKIENGTQGALIGLPSDSFADPNGPIRPLQTSPIPPDSYSQGAIIDHDLAQTFAVDAVAQGTNAPGSQSATEANLRQANVNVREGSEQGFVADWYLGLVDKLSTLVQRYVSVEEAAMLVGMDQAVAWDAWRKQIPAPIAFEMTPDSSLRNDAPLDRLQLQQLYSYLANDPTINRRYLNTKVAEKWHLDPTKLLLPEQQAPKPQPKESSVSFAIDMKLMDPRMPQFWIAVDVLQHSGRPLSPQIIEWAKQVAGIQSAIGIPPLETEPPDETQPEHGGKVAQVESLDKHASERTGGQSNTGEPMVENGGGRVN